MAHMTSRQAVERLGVSHRTLMRMVHADEIKTIEKVPGRTGAYIFDSDEVERVFAAITQRRKAS